MTDDRGHCTTAVPLICVVLLCGFVWLTLYFFVVVAQEDIHELVAQEARVDQLIAHVKDQLKQLVSSSPSVKFECKRQVVCFFLLLTYGLCYCQSGRVR